MIKGRKRVIFIICSYLSIFIILPFVSSFLLKDYISPLNCSNHHVSKSIQADNYEIIFVDGNQGFDSEIWSGSGTNSSPYFIDGLSINQENQNKRSKDDLIKIIDTDSFFHINNCILIGGNNGITLANVTNGKIINNTIYSNEEDGIYVTNSKNITICNNKVYKNAFNGIHFHKSINNIIYENYFYDNENRGFFLYSSPNNTIYDNKFLRDGLFISAIQINDYFQTNVIGNLIDGKPIIFWENRNDLITPLNSNQIILINCTSINITNQILSVGFIGIQITLCNNVIIENNSFSELIDGIEQYLSANVKFHNNTIKESLRSGINLYSSKNNSIYNNTINDCSYSGIVLDSSSENYIINNSIYNNSYSGISLTFSPTNYIANNTVSDNIEYGIYLYDSSNNSIINNSLGNNEFYISSFILQDSIQYSVQNNFVNGKDLLFHQNSKFTGGISSLPKKDSIGQIILINCTDTEINEFNSENCNYGIFTGFCSNITIFNNSISVIMYNTDNSIIFNNIIEENDSYCIYLSTSDHNQILNNTINNLKTGVYFVNSFNNTMINNIIFYEFSMNSSINSEGMYIDCSENNFIINNTFYNLSTGIILFLSPNNRIENNSISVLKIGIYFEESGNCTILNNSMKMCGFRFTGYIINDFLQFRVERNYINNKPLVYLENVDTEAVPPNAGQIFLINCTSMNIKEYFFDACSIGVTLAHCTNTTISNNSFSKNFGGIEVYVSENITVSNNIIYNDTDFGIHLKYSSNSSINDNILNYANINGIHLYSSMNNTISYNIILSNVKYGLVLQEDSTNNTIHYNDFILNNTLNGTSQAYDEGFNNTFVYNHWSDWRTPDIDNDGIVDFCYSINGSSNNLDPYPLTDPNRYIYPKEDLLTIQDILTFVFLIFLSFLFITEFTLLVLISRKKREKYVASLQLLPKKSWNMEEHSRKSNLLAYNFELSKTVIESKKSSNLVKPPDDRITIKVLKIGFISSIIWTIVFCTLYQLEKRKLTQNEVLKNPIRNRILEILYQDEFVHFGNLRRQLDCGVSILLWHLQVLKDFKLISEKKIGQFRLFHLTSRVIDEKKIQLYTEIRSKKAIFFLQTILNMRKYKWFIREIIKKSNLHRKVVKYYSEKMVNFGILKYNAESKMFTLVKEQVKYLSWIIERYTSEMYV